MPALTKTQLAHAISRVETARQTYVQRYVAELGPEPEVIDYDSDGKIKMIRAGKAVMKKNVYYRTDLVDAFDYPVTDAMKEVQLQADAWQAKHDAIVDKAQAIEGQLVDELVMSPDGVSALARIAAAFA